MIQELPIAKARVVHEAMVDKFGVHIMTGWHPARTEHLMPLSPLAVQTVEHGGLTPNDPAFFMTRPSAEALLQALWDAGLRPKETPITDESKSVIAAKNEHISDLRRIIFKEQLSPEAKTW